MRIYCTTAVVRPGGIVAFYGDVYGHDARLERALAKGYPYVWTYRIRRVSGP